MADSLSQITDNKKTEIRRSVELLPILFRTEKNSKFLAGTLDQLIQTPQLKRVDGWVGSKLTPTYNPEKDFYLESNLKLRQDYQLEPALVITDEVFKIIKSTSYDDLINQLDYEGANVSRLDRLLKPEFYSYDPHIDWDKFINFEKYYWVPLGLPAVTIANEQKEITSTYNVTDSSTGDYFIFTPDGLTPLPQVTLYKGVTYKFNIKSSKTFWIKTIRMAGKEAPYRVAENNGIKEGTITLTLDYKSPKTLYFVSEEDVLNGGELVIKTVEDNTSIDVEKEIVGKKSYTSFNNITFTNGLKVKFTGHVTPAIYQDKEFIVEGVGKTIKLIEYNSLSTPENYAALYDETFDDTGFDEYAFDEQSKFPTSPEYITINRSSKDRNPWSRYNRWVHEDVIRLSATANNVPVLLPFENRAKRPIIEFDPDIQLNNFGSFAKSNIQFIDTLTTDVFTRVEGQLGYYVDGEELGQGDRVIFTADTDNFVNGKTYVVNFVKINDKFRISLEEAEDVTPIEGDSIIITKGTNNKGTSWWYNGTEWVYAQQKTVINQAPRFEIFNNDAVSYSDRSTYNTVFTGSKVFGYAIGTGVNDSILGFPLSYRDVANQGYYLFKNYFMSDAASIISSNSTSSLNVSSGFLKRNVARDNSEYINVWTESSSYEIPILQYQIITADTVEIPITSIDNPGYQTLSIEVFVNSDKKVLLEEYTLYPSGRNYSIIFKNPLVAGDKVLLKIVSNAPVSSTGVYEPSLGWTNNPLNGPINEFTLSELNDHVKTMIDRHPEFYGVFPGTSNMRDIADVGQYGTRLISNKNPTAFAGYFIANDEFNLISATRLVGQHYNQFKLGLINQIASLSGKYTPIQAVDIALYNINANKDVSFPYALSDMAAYGTDVVTRTYPVTDSRNTTYSLTDIFNLTSLSGRSVLVYHTDLDGNTVQLIHGSEYYFDLYDSSVHILKSLVKGEVITVDDYHSTDGCYIPPTPTKLGLYPKFEPKIFVDDTYSETQTVIQGHDGSIIVAFGDDRDAALLEFERRIFNNIKTNYNSELLDITKIMPGAFRANDYTPNEVNAILAKEFLKWDSFYGFNYSNNNTFEDTNHKSWNFKTGKDKLTKLPLPGGWRGVYKYFFDTDRPHSHPWEMLGFPIMPVWWETVYGPAPYTKDNLILWEDLEKGLIKYPGHNEINSLYARPGLSTIIPVDENGNLLTPNAANLATGIDYLSIADNWIFGDQGPVETAWRRSSLWPFAVQILLASTCPATYSSLLFDTSRMTKNLAGQYVYGTGEDFPSFDVLKIFQDTVDDAAIRAAGYSVFLIEAGKQKNRKYISKLKDELLRITSKLTHKVGGFISKDKFKIVVDSVNPASASPGVTLANEDYSIFLDKSSPIQSLGVSGVIVERTLKGYSVRGYDNKNPYFNCLMPIYSSTDPALVIGGNNETFVEWTASSANPISNFDTTSVSTNDGYRFYKKGQIVKYFNQYYRTRISHNSGTTFNIANFQILSALPRVGGVAVQRPSQWERVVTLIPYGNEYEKIDDVYSMLLGWGHWLESQGVIFSEFNNELGEVLNWTFAAKEAAFWSTQRWAVGSVITLSPFSNTVRFSNSKAIVDDLTNTFYEYSVLKADGSPLPSKYISINREENDFKLATTNTRDGIFFVRLNLIQKEHTLVLENYTLFNDVIYDIETGYRQRRVKLLGFVTDNWNGDIFSPGFMYDQANITTWQQYQDYSVGDVVFYASNYYVANSIISGSELFVSSSWDTLGEKPIAQLLPNFDYKINQFEDFYSLDIDNYDQSQQSLAQHLIGYTPRPYLDNIFISSISQYKFYQGFIKEKGTRNTINKLGKASVVSQGSYIDFYEDWAFRAGQYGSFTTNQTLEINLDETKFIENPQIIEFVNTVPDVISEFIIYQSPSDVVIKPDDYNSVPFTTVDNLVDDSIAVLPTAGYVRLDDVSATAVNNNSLLDIAGNRNIKEGDTVWMGFQKAGGWDVFRYTQVPTVVIDASIIVPGTSLLLMTQDFHGVSIGDVISVSQFDSLIDGVYTVVDTPTLTQILIDFSPSSLITPFSPGIGLLFKFASSRYNTFDAIQARGIVGRMQVGEKLWIDDDGQGKWIVYEKKNNFYSSNATSPTYDYALSSNQLYGTTITGNQEGNHIAISAPKFWSNILDTYGRIYLYRKEGTSTSNMSLISSITPNYSSVNTYFTGTNETNFGVSMEFDSDNDYVISGAPLASGVRYSLLTNQFSTVSSMVSYYPPANYTEQGFIKFSKVNFEEAYIEHEQVFASPQPQTGAEFGHDMHLGNITTSDKILFVSSPGQDSDKGAVHYNKFTIIGADPLIGTASTIAYGRLPSGTLSNNSRFGASVSGNYLGSTVVVGSPGEDKIYIFTSTNYDSYATHQTLSITNEDFVYVVNEGEGFGETVLMDRSGEYLFISVSRATDDSLEVGKVFVMKRNSITNQYELNQTISNPYISSGYNFGADIEIDSTGKTLVITSLGSSHRPLITYDTYTDRQYTTNPSDDHIYVLDPTSTERLTKTTFDSNTVGFYATIENSGAVFTFNRENDQFVFGQELYDQLVTSEQVYGSSVHVSDNCVIIGGPGISSEVTQVGVIYAFDIASDTLSSWVPLRTEDPLVDLTKFRTIKTIDTVKESVIDYLEIIDPVKGKIAGIADQELLYKSSFDPAVYSVGVSGVVVDHNSNWIDNHVGELWWDLSSVKFMWYEQGELEYRKNYWNAIFPGSMIDVYEWVGTPYLPTQWAAIADTHQGLAAGMSGQPKFSDNNTISLKQIWDPISNSFSNFYYYWVKNKITVPEGIDRKTSAYNVAALIADPKGQGIKFVAPIAENALMLTNMQGSVIGKKINVSIDRDIISNDINKHTEWILVQEGNEASLPTTRLYTKMIESLLGRDNLGNAVPDPALPDRLKYGVEVRPRQSMFKNKKGAVRTFVEYANTILEKNNIVDFANLEKFLEKDPIPNALLGQYDDVVEDIIERDFRIVTRNLKRAQLSCSISNGKIISVNIDNPGFGYGILNLKTEISNDLSVNYIGPTITIDGVGTGAKLNTEVNIVGEIVRVNITNPGSGYKTAPTLTVRPFTIIVSTDENTYNLWSKYEWDYDLKTYNRVYSQSYDTNNYWKYIDWVHTSYNPAQDILATIDEPYQLSALTNVPEGNYVKIKNAGDGRYIILRRVSANQLLGSYNSNYDLIYQENGTIRILDSVWNYDESVYGWEQSSGFDQTLFDQNPERETENIVYGILDNVFVNYLKVYKNKMFFKMVKYAMTEQKLLDWAFKTSFINVINYAGALDQRAVYKLNNESYYQEYIKETKPYHTKVRNFSVNYTATDVTKSITTDFDCPGIYDQIQKQFVPITFGSTQLTQYPWKSWAENYSYSVGSIDVADGGVGYDIPPIVEIVPQVGDLTGTGAKAVAYIALGKVTRILVTSPGSGYTATPVINLKGGGSSELTPAKVSLRMSNEKVRANSIHMKFDRVSGYNEIQSPTATDTFVADGVIKSFDLTWAPNPDKNFITVRVKGIKVLSGDFSIDVYTKKYNGYTKKCGRFVLDVLPKIASTITIEYRKDLALYHAVDRIRDYYNPISGMPGNTATLLMNGLEYPGVTLDTLPFELSRGFDTLPYGMNNWDDFVPEAGYYATTGTNSTSTFTLPYVPQEDQRINVYVNSVRIDGNTATGAVMNTFIGNGFVNSINIKILTTSTDIVAFRLETSDGSAPIVDIDLDTYISGGGYYTNISGKLELTNADDLEDIIIDGDKFITPTNSHGPEENIPGRVSDSLGINVFTYPESGTGRVITKKYIRDRSQTRYKIGFTPLNVDSVEVLLNHTLLEYETNYTIDFDSNEIVLLGDPLIDPNIGPYFNTDLVVSRREGTVIASTAGDDTYTGAYPLGFEWNMFGTLYNSVYVGTNGYLTFGGGDSYYTPLKLGYLTHPAIYIEFCDLWQGYGTGNNNTIQLETGETPGLFLSNGTIGDFTFWRLRFQGTHYNRRSDSPTVPAYEYEVTLYSNGTDQYIEMIYENTWTGVNFNGDKGFITGVARERVSTVMGEGIEIDDSLINPNTSHVFYSTSNGGNWKYAGRGSFDAFKNQNIITTPEILAITTISVGGTNPLGHEVLNINAVTGYNNFEFSPNYLDVNSTYVTVNGIKRTDFTLHGTSASGMNGRTLLEFDQILVSGDLLQVWFFASADKGFSEVKEQIFAAVRNITSFTLSQPPGNIAPLHSQIIVERDGVRLAPPDTVYYIVANGQKDFSLEQHYNYIDGLPDRKTVEVYVNGIRRKFGEKLRLIQDANLVRFSAKTINDGDVIAISILREHEYYVDGANVVLTSRVDVSYSSTIKVVTFTNHDSSLIRKERFPGNYRGMFKLSRNVLNSNYVWVEINGKPLTKEFQFTIERDNRTVLVNDSIRLSDTDAVVITTVVDQVSEQLMGYRYFQDNLGRIHYKRISRENSTQLTSDVYPTDTSITVEDASVLTPPSPMHSRPGVVLIDGERIEFFTIEGNKLTTLRRGTLGTGVKLFHKEGSTAIDQGALQNIPVVNSVRVWKTATQYIITGTSIVDDHGKAISASYSNVGQISSSGTGTGATFLVTKSGENSAYAGSTSVILVDPGTNYYTGDTITLDGLQLGGLTPDQDLSLAIPSWNLTNLAGIQFNTATSVYNQIDVFYQGRRLRKPDTSTFVITDTAIAYDSGEVNSLGESSNITLPPEFVITTGTNILKLTFIPVENSEIKVVTNTATVVGFEYADAHNRDKEQIKFLLDSPSLLPDKYYYGQNTDTDQYVTLEGGDTLDSETGDPLIGS
jgi:hypothetical protein